MPDETIYIVIGILVVAVIGLGLAYIYKPVGSKDSFLANLEWRRATKHFVPGEVDTGPIELAMINAPSSFGLQPYSIVRVTDPELKKQLRPFCFDQEQVETCHVVYVLCALKDVEKRMEQYLTETKAEPMRAMIKGFLDACPDKIAWAAKQAYITLGFGLAAAAERRAGLGRSQGREQGEKFFYSKFVLKGIGRPHIIRSAARRLTPARRARAARPRMRGCRCRWRGRAACGRHSHGF